MMPEMEGELRDHLARERTKLAIERTLLAYIRTALAFAVVGIPGLFMFESVVIQLLGGLSLFLGVLVVGYAIFRYSQVKRHL
jgi:putative membrane protein